MSLPKQTACEIAKAPDLMALVSAGLMSQAVYVAAELGIADLLARGRKDLAELAQASGSSAPSLHRLLRALASLGVCTECDDGKFELAAMGGFLRRDVPNSLH